MQRYNQMMIEAKIMNESINDRIKILYENENLSVDEFAKKIGLKTGSIRNMFSRGTYPRFETLNRIINNFSNYSMNWLFTGDGEMKLETNSTFIDEKINNSNAEHWKNKYIKILEENRELRIEIDSLKIQIEKFGKKFAKEDSDAPDVQTKIGLLELAKKR